MKNKFIKLILADAAIAVALVVMYSPGLLCLRPSDESILRAGFSILGGIVSAYLLLKVNLFDLMEKPAIEADKVQSAAQCQKLLKSISTGMFEKEVESAAGQLEKADKYQKSLKTLFSEKFEPGSLSYDRFDSAMEDAVSAITKNCLSLAYRVQMVDEQEYRKTKKLVESGSYREDDIPDNIQEEKYGMYGKNHDAIRDILALNEKLLFQLEELSMEVSALELKDTGENSGGVLEQLKELIDQTKYYQ